MEHKTPSNSDAHLKLALPSEQKAWLRVRAARLETTMSNEVGKAIELYRSHVEREVEQQANRVTR